MINNIYKISSILSIAVLHILYHYFIKKSTNSKSIVNLHFLLSIAILIISSFVYFYTIKDKIKLGTLHSLIHSFDIILIFLLGYFVFNEKINKLQILGVILMIIGILILTYYEKE